jgi:hypothetical protein
MNIAETDNTRSSKQKGNDSEKATNPVDKPVAIDLFPNRTPLKKLRAIWNEHQEPCTDGELLQIRDWLYMLADVSVSIAKRGAVAVPLPIKSITNPVPPPAEQSRSAKVLALYDPTPQSTNEQQQEAESNSIRSRIYGRTG